jgi:hypothetical protein
MKSIFNLFLSEEERLKQDVEARLAQAEKRKIKDKAVAVAHYLTTPSLISQNSAKSDYCYCYKDKHLELKYNCSSYYSSDSLSRSELSIYVGSKMVFQTSAGWCRIECYIPGQWEEHLNKLAIQAESQRKEQEQNRKNAELAEKRRNFGL